MFRSNDRKIILRQLSPGMGFFLFFFGGGGGGPGFLFVVFVLVRGVGGE